MSEMPMKRDSAIDAQDNTKPQPLTRWKECARIVGLEPRKKKSETPSEETKAEEGEAAKLPSRKPVGVTVSNFWWGPPSTSGRHTVESTRLPTPTTRRHTTESTRLPSRTANIQTSADLPSQRARVSLPPTSAQIADRRPRLARRETSAELSPQRARVAQPLTNPQVEDRRPRTTSTQSSVGVPSRASNVPAPYQRTSSDLGAYFSSTTAPTSHRRILSDPQTTIGLATSTPNSLHLRPAPCRPTAHLARAQTSLTPHYSYPLHAHSPQAWVEVPRSQRTFPGATGLTSPYAVLPPLEPCPAPPSFRYPRSTAVQRNTAPYLDPGIAFGTAPLDVKKRDASSQTDADLSRSSSDNQTLRERRNFLQRAKIVQETMSGLRRRLSGSSKRSSVEEKKSSSVEEKKGCVCICHASPAADAGVRPRTGNGSIDESVDRGAGRKWRVTNAGPGDEAYFADEGKRRDGSEKLEEKIEEEKKNGRRTMRQLREDTKTGSRKKANGCETNDIALEEVPDLPIPADVLAAGTSARLRRRSSLPPSAQLIDTSIPRLIERIPAALATYTHANSSNTFASDRSTVLRRRMSCCDVEARMAALVSSSNSRHLQLRVKEEAGEGEELKVQQWRGRVARLEIEIDRMVAGGLLDQFEELVERLHILEDERKAFLNQ